MFIKNSAYYFWFPVDLGAYILEQDTAASYLFEIDTTILAATFSTENSKLAKFYDGKKEGLSEEKFTIIKNRKHLPFTMHSIKNAGFFADFKAIIDNSGANSIGEMGALCQILQNQINYSRTNPTKRKYLLALDSLAAGQKFIRTWTYENTDYENKKLDNPYEYLTINEFNNTRLVLPDYEIDSLLEIKAYAAQTKPTLIYWKRNYRTSFHYEPYYYFIFYYVDFSPFLPRLRDMQVVFPRRFGLS